MASHDTSNSCASDACHECPCQSTPASPDSEHQQTSREILTRRLDPVTRRTGPRVRQHLRRQRVSYHVGRSCARLYRCRTLASLASTSSTHAAPFHCARPEEEGRVDAGAEGDVYDGAAKVRARCSGYSANTVRSWPWLMRCSVETLSMLARYHPAERPNQAAAITVTSLTLHTIPYGTVAVCPPVPIGFKQASPPVADDGPSGLRIDRLCRRLGVSKGSFHHHFAGAGDFKQALLAAYEALVVEALNRSPTTLNLRAARRQR
jgi:hypothetical protein